jgi:hypothetical protein
MSVNIRLLGRSKAKRDLRREIPQEASLKVVVRKKQLMSALKAATPVDTGRARAGWHMTMRGIENEVPYIGRLNQGSSKQAPALFIERTLLRHGDVRPSGIIVRSK